MLASHYGGWSDQREAGHLSEDMGRSVPLTPVPASLTEYWEASRAPRYSILLALPLLVAYEALAAFLSTGQSAELRNGADVLLRELFLAIAGRRYAPLVLGITVIGLSVWYIVRDLRAAGTPLRGGMFVAMLGEAGVWALCFGSVVGSLTSHLVGVFASERAPAVISWPTGAFIGWTGPVAHALGAGGIPQGGSIADAPTVTKVMLALGAGVYEELLFRVVLVSAIAFIGRRLLGWRPMVAAGVAVVASALIFASFHYIGPYGDPLRLDSFVFRLIGGLAFSLLYVTRGFGITAWTHAVYDLLVLAV
jgi:hypothetical protein